MRSIKDFEIKSDFIEFTAPEVAELVSVEVAKVGPLDVLIEAEVSLVSVGTERSFMKKAPYYPFRPGYSLVGRIVEKGAEVSDFQIGDRVKASVHHGSYVVCDHRMVFKVPQDIPAEHAAFAPVGAMAICAVRTAQIKWGDPVMIMGQGVIGLIATQLARMQGAIPLIVTDVDPDRLERARAFGADIASDARDVNGLEDIARSLPGGGFAAVVELSGGADVMDQAIGLCRRRGRIVAASLGAGAKPTDLYGLAWLKSLSFSPVYFNARPWQLRQIEVTSPLEWPIRPFDGGEYDGNEIDTSAGDFNLFMTFLRSGRIDVGSLIEKNLTAREAVGAFNDLVGSPALGVVINWNR